MANTSAIIKMQRHEECHNAHLHIVDARMCVNIGQIDPICGIY